MKNAIVGGGATGSPAHTLPGIDRRPNGQLSADRWLRFSSPANGFAVGELAATGEGVTVVSTMRHPLVDQC